MSLPVGNYRTPNGSRLVISGKHGGMFTVDFDWFEEPKACIDCLVQPEPVDFGDGEHRLVWYCDECGGGSAVLIPEPAAEPDNA